MPTMLPLRRLPARLLVRWLASRAPKDLDPGYAMVNGVRVPSWACHVCGHVRPDDRIAVYSRRYDVMTGDPSPAGTVRVNVRFCRDQPTCERKAPLKAHEWTEYLRRSARNREMVKRVIG